MSGVGPLLKVTPHLPLGPIPSSTHTMVYSCTSACTQPPTVVCKMEAQYLGTHCIHVLARLRPICIPSRCFLTFLHWSSVGSLLRCVVGWVVHVVQWNALLGRQDARTAPLIVCPDHQGCSCKQESSVSCTVQGAARKLLQLLLNLIWHFYWSPSGNMT